MCVPGLSTSSLQPANLLASHKVSSWILWSIFDVLLMSSLQLFTEYYSKNGNNRDEKITMLSIHRYESRLIHPEDYTEICYNHVILLPYFKQIWLFPHKNRWYVLISNYINFAYPDIFFYRRYIFVIHFLNFSDEPKFL